MTGVRSISAASTTRLRSVFDLVQKAGFALYEPDGQTLELMRRIFSYTGGKTVGTTSMVRKRLAAWKTPGKQNVYAFHNG